jgi:hypothetical protein
MINELSMLVKAIRVEDATYLTRDMSIISPDLRGELVLCNFNRLHEVASTGIDLDVFASRCKQDLRESPDTATPPARRRIVSACASYMRYVHYILL